MKKENYENFSKNWSSEVKKRDRCIFILLLINLALTVVLFRVSGNEKKILIPSSNPELAMWISNDSISPEYMEFMGRLIISLALNVSPETVEQQSNEFLFFTTPELRSYLINSMKSAEQKIIQNGISQTFYIDQIKAVMRTQTLYITGYLKTFIGNQQTSNHQQVYKLKFKTNSMNVKLSEFRQLDPNLDGTEMKDVGI